jgi:toxin ParE1/3/4
VKIRFTPQATSDLIAIADYIRARNPAAAMAVRDAILTSIQLLALFPEIGRRQTTAGIRKLIVRRYRYLVYYAVHDADEEVAILSIQHPSRRREYSDL